MEEVHPVRQEKLNPDFNAFKAAERTFLAWIRTGISLIGLGFVVSKFNLFVSKLNLFLQAARIPNAKSSIYQPGVSEWLGVSLVAVGILVLIFAGYFLNRDLQAIRDFSFKPRAPVFEYFLVAGLGLIGIILLIYLFISGHALAK
jgi:putative membrane protein